jgi:hypothetical protein
MVEYVAQYGFLQAAKPGLPLAGEDFGDRNPRALLNFIVGIPKWET